MEVGVIAARLIAYVIDGVDPKLEKDMSIDHDALYAFSKSHSVDNIAGIALKKLNIMPPQYEKAYEKAYKISRAREATQELETQDIIEELECRGIKHMLLKGSVMKNLYPSPELRSMCDVDILYDTAHLVELEEIMTERGYELKEASGTGGINVSYVRKPFMNIEFHGVLMDSDIPLYNAYFGNDFEHTVADKGCRVKYPDEDFFVFMMAHLAKHYFHGGTGIRSLADIWLFLRKKPSLDMKAVREKLKIIRLDKFTDIIIGVNGVLFDGKEPTAQQSDIINYIFHSGTYGTAQHHSAEGIKQISKRQYVLKRLFPDREFMSINYPAVKKCALLLPLFWLIRLVKVAVKKGYKGSDVDLVMSLDESRLDARKIPGCPFDWGDGNNPKPPERKD